MRRRRQSLSTARFALRLALAVLIAGGVCLGAQSALLQVLAVHTVETELVQRAENAASAASAQAGANALTPLSNHSLVDLALTPLTSDPEVTEVTVLGGDGTVISVVTAPNRTTPTAAAQAGQIAPAGQAAQAGQATQAGQAATPASSLAVRRAADTTLAVLGDRAVIRREAQTLIVTVPVHHGGIAAAVEVRWLLAPALRRAVTLRRAQVSMVALGASLLVPATFAAGGWALSRRYRAQVARSNTDEATGLTVRSIFAQDLARLVSAPRAADQELALAMVDLNGLSLVNDNYGRRRGDALIGAVGSTILEWSGAERRTQVQGVYRLSGDCFAAILDIGALPDAIADGEDLRRRIITHAEPMTANLGIAVLDGTRCSDAETLLIAAETALHEARSMGGNRVVTAGSGAGSPRWQVGDASGDELLRELAREMSGIWAQEPGEGPASLDLRDAD